MRLRAGLKTVFGATGLALCLAPSAHAANIAVPLDEVRIIAFARPVSTVYVGNPTIADVSVIDSRHVFVLGKAFGATNMIALDSKGNPIVNTHVAVSDHTAGSTVTLQRGAARVTYACAGAQCEFAPTPGDAADAFSATMGQISAHQDMNVKSASNAPQ
ncbi:MAG TPA: pilus assembly protein N-terminal domain-containing protein [Rhizomicrobium sp.]|jgi:Flp pilus assembly secretin CpaC|nr:pilus assembly protein N-terminal domain-containing protein [Rhizomicrobium sp.]